MIRGTLSIALVLSALGHFTARGDFITSLTETTTPKSGSVFLYSYTLANDPASTLNAEGLGITISPDADIQSIVGPTGWDITYYAGNSLISWESSDPSMYFIAPADIATFSFVSRLAPSQQPYLVTGLDTSGINFDTNSGNIASPGTAAVPEPATLLLLGTGLLGLRGLAMSRRSE